MLDDTDRRLLRHLLADPGIAMNDLAERANVAPATAWRRVERLTESGIIRAQEAVIDWRAMGYGVEVSLRFGLDKTVPRAFDEFTAAAREVPEVLAIETFLGRVDLRLNVIARDMAHWQDIYRHRILTLPHITDIEALMLISTLKHAEALPV